MSKLASVLVRNSTGYPHDILAEGLAKLGYEVATHTVSKPDLVVTWTPWRNSMADRYGSRWSDRWLVFENGYIPEIEGVKYYSIGLGGYNGNGFGTPDLGRKLELEIAVKPQNINRTGYILVIGQFGHPDTRYSMPLYWPENVLQRIRNATSRPIVYRPKPRYKRNRELSIHIPDLTVDEESSIDELLMQAYCVVTWNSPTISVKSVLSGIPTFIDGPNCIAKAYSAGTVENIESPRTVNRRPLLHCISNQQFSADEIRSGECLYQLTERLGIAA